MEPKGKNNAMIGKSVYSLVVICLLVYLLAGCTTISEQYTATFVPGTQAVLSIKENKNGRVWGEFTNPLLPGATITGDIEHTDEGMLFYVTRVRFFTNWSNGWTEGVYEASGTYLLEGENKVQRISVGDEFTLWDIIEGEIRYFDTYHRGDAGFRKVKHRVDRMTEISRYLREEKQFPRFYTRFEGAHSPGLYAGEAEEGRGSFAGDIIPYLFPEARGLLSCKERRIYFEEENPMFPPDVSEASGERVLGAEVLWYTEYSKKILPEQYLPLRDSGTLWRDYEEASRLFYTIYNLDSVMNHTITDMAFIRTR